MLVVADYLITGLHLVVVFGFLFLWIPRRTVRIHRWLVVCTAASWLVLGAFRGLGYCFLTDLGWQVKHALGERRLPRSFIKYAADAVAGRSLPADLVDAVTGAVFVAGVAIAVWRFAEERRLARGGAS